MPSAHSFFVSICAITMALALTSCEREQRQFRAVPPAGDRVRAVRMGELQLGAALPASVGTHPYEGNAYAISEGKRLYAWFNCTGCHAHGGGGIGPALMDPVWIYGSEPENIFASIVDGRPNGMPSFYGRILPDQVWQLVAYVRSISGFVPKTAIPVRDDHRSVTTPEPSTRAARSTRARPPKVSESAR